MWELWIIVGLLAVFFVWAGHHIGKRTSDPSSRDEQDRDLGRFGNF